ncbi:MAG: hypothetical protein IJM30_02735 [Thermoguttaceae bacterium]|nr:hypothetical protein [Thermoguttaceae bacterium]
MRDVLNYRFGAEPEETELLLANKTLDELDALTANVFQCPSFEEFRERL